MNTTYTFRPGVTLVELLLFTAISAIMAGTIIPMLISATESRQRQDAIALVEQNGEQMLQSIITEVRNSERVLDPPTGSNGLVLALQNSSGALNPTLFAISDGALVKIQGRRQTILSSPLVGIHSFAIDNTSIDDERESIAVSFNVRRIIRLHRPLVYDSRFDTVINVNPDNELATQTCNCLQPYCDGTGSGEYIWEACIENRCVLHGAFLCVDND